MYKLEYKNNENKIVMYLQYVEFLIWYQNNAETITDFSLIKI